ncbi:MAG: hypothetical protein WC659_01355 [Patescibacteria group bacterium]
MPRLTPHIKKYIALTATVIVQLITPLPSIAAPVAGEIQGNLFNAGNASGLGTKDLAITVGGIIQAMLTIIGVIFLALIVYAGFKWMLARGRTEEVESAQKIIESSIIGLIVIILAYAISKFVFSIILAGAGVQ